MFFIMRRREDSSIEETYSLSRPSQPKEERTLIFVLLDLVNHGNDGLDISVEIILQP